MWGWADLLNFVDSETGRPFALFMADELGPLGPWCRIVFYAHAATGLEAIALDDITSVVFNPEYECTAREEAEGVWVVTRKDGAVVRMTGQPTGVLDPDEGPWSFDPEG